MATGLTGKTRRVKEGDDVIYLVIVVPRNESVFIDSVTGPVDVSNLYSSLLTIFCSIMHVSCSLPFHTFPHFPLFAVNALFPYPFTRPVIPFYSSHDTKLLRLNQARVRYEGVGLP